MNCLIRRLGFVQVDSINTVERAHHMILWSRRQTYRPKALGLLHARDRDVFEHWTHDASIIPMEFLPYWHLRFARDAERLRARYRGWQGPEFEAVLEDVIRHIAEQGPVGSGDIGERDEPRRAGWWDWHPSKTALEYLWRSGRLAVARRVRQDLRSRAFIPMWNLRPCRRRSTGPATPRSTVSALPHRGRSQLSGPSSALRKPRLGLPPP